MEPPNKGQIIAIRSGVLYLDTVPCREVYNLTPKILLIIFYRAVPEDSQYIAVALSTENLTLEPSHSLDVCSSVYS